MCFQLLRAAIVALACALVAAADAAPTSFRTLYEAHRWFDLRDAVAADSHAPGLYRGAVAYAFHNLAAAEKLLRAVVRAAPRSEEAIEAHSLLISVAQMNGDYGGALTEIRTLRPIVPDASGLATGESFFTALASYPRQSIASRQGATVPSSIRGGNLFVPASVNDREITCIIDTGANFSLISEGDARRLSLEIRDAPGVRGTDSSGASVPFRIAVARRLAVGGFVLRNVVFLVAGDDQQPFVDLPAGSRAVLGMPVLLAFETLRWTRNGTFTLGMRTVRTPVSDANVCFDGADAYAAATYQGKRIDVFLDSGATKTRLTAAFGRDFPAALEKAQTHSSTVRGVGGSATVEVAQLEPFMLRLADADLRLDSVEALLKDPDGRTNRFHVWVGFDLLSRARTWTLDFRSMKLTID